MIVLSTSYLPPIQYLTKFLLNEEVVIEKFGNYQKQSYRNRCYIYGANGKQCLVIPVVKKHGEKAPISSVQIDYKSNWQKIHLKSVESAYRLSAFYEYYTDDFCAAYDQSLPYLLDWNMFMLNTVLKMLGINQRPELTKLWNTEYAMDYRNNIHPKKRMEKPDARFNPVPYQQVFIERYGFISNLSIIDLLFNEGPQALQILKESIK